MVELLVTLAILSILFSTAMPNLAAAHRIAYEKLCHQEIASVRDAMNAYFKDHSFSYQGATLPRLGPYGYLHFDSKLIVNMWVQSNLTFVVTVAVRDGIWIRHTLWVDSNTGETRYL